MVNSKKRLSLRCLLVVAEYSVEIYAEMQNAKKDTNANLSMVLKRLLQNRSTSCQEDTFMAEGTADTLPGSKFMLYHGFLGSLMTRWKRK